MKTIAVLIPVHNGLIYTKRAIPLLKDAMGRMPPDACEARLVVIDDGSADGTRKWLGLEHPDVFVVPGNGDLWWSGSVNAGIEFSEKKFKPDFFLLWNNDLVIEGDYFENLCNILEEYDQDTIIASKVYFLDNSDKVFSMGGRFNRFSGIARVINHRLANRMDLSKPLEVDWFGGMGTLIPKKIIDKVGLFDASNFPHYKGDFDFALRAKKGGAKIVAHPGLRIWNDTSQTGLAADNFKTFIKSFTDKKSQYNIAENIRFYKRHAPVIFGWYGFFLKYLIYFVKYIIFTVKRNFWGKKNNRLSLIV